MPGNFENLPKATHYSSEDFHADSQFWTMAQDQDGILYFGNNDGVMIYDGERWQKVVLPNHSSVRSLATTPAGKVYAGGFNEIGLIEKDSMGAYKYVSLLKDLKLKNAKLENLWQVHVFKNYIIYRSFSDLIVISGNTATRIPSFEAFTYSGIVGDAFYVQDSGQGIFEFDPEAMQLNMIFEAEDYNDDQIVGFLPFLEKNKILLASKNGNIYKGDIRNKKLQLWRKIFGAENKDQIISTLKKEGVFFFGTLSSRILLLTEQGEVIRKSSAFDNITNSSILNLYKKDGDIWALLNNGIDFIEYDPPVSLLFNEASVYDILIDTERVYLATNKGVYYSNISTVDTENYVLDFMKIPNLEGQAWSVQKIEDAIFVGHDKGLFLLQNGSPYKIGEVNGFWKVIPLKDVPGTYLAANYNGLYLLKKNHGKWQLQHKIKGFNESTRDILQGDEENTFWVCHGYKGIYKLKINEDYSRIFAIDHYTDQNGLDSPFNVDVKRWNNDIVFTTNHGIYQFDENNNYFEPYQPLNNILDTVYNTRKLIRHGEKVWVVQDDAIGYFNTTKNNPEVKKDLFLNVKGNLNRGMESIYPLQEGKVLIGATTGLFLYDTKSHVQSHPIPTKFTSIIYTQEKEQQALPLAGTTRIDIPTRTDILRFEFAVPQMSPSSNVQYQYTLEGIDKNWSPWQNNPYKEYTHLRSGDYVFKVRSRNLSGMKGEEASFNFHIPPVWYQTSFAYLVYILVFIVVFILVVYLVRQKIEYERNKAKIAAQKTKQLLELEINELKLKQEKENIRKDKQLLEEDNIYKSKELADYTMKLVKKKDIFTETYSNLQEFRKMLKTQTARKRLQEILMELKQHRIGEEYMNVFDANFERVHKYFFKELKTLNPKLTRRELRLCAFVKMNLTNKEIAPLLNISVRGVETARYRVRKKLNVKEINFLAFLENISAPTTKT